MKSIRGRLIVGLLVGLTLLVAAFGASLYVSLKTLMIQDFDRSSLAKAQALAAMVTRKRDGRIEFEFADDYMPEFSGGHRAEYFEIWGPERQVVGHSRSLGESRLERLAGPPKRPRFEDLRLPDGRVGRAVGMEFVPPGDVESYREHSPPLASGQVPPALTIVVARGREPIDHYLEMLATAIVLAGLILPLGIALIVWVVVYRGLRPLAAVATTAATIDADQLDCRFPTLTMPRELQPICRRLNDLLERVGGAFDRERRFNQAVAHELRTPIAELRTVTEVAMMDQPAGSPESETLNEVLSIALQMEQLVGQLLTLTRGDAGRAAASADLADLRAVMEQALAAVADPDDRRRIAVEWPAAGPLTARCSAVLLKSILCNLLTNAVEYSPAGTPIDIHVAAGGPRLSVTMRNRNVNMAADDVRRCFEPFWRKESSRTGNEHYGLGLSLVATFSRSIGGAVQARLEDDRLAIELTLPRA